MEIPSADVAVLDRHHKLSTAVSVAIGKFTRVSVCSPVKNGLLCGNVVAHELDRQFETLPKKNTSAGGHQPIPARRELNKRLIVVALPTKSKTVRLGHAVLVNQSLRDRRCVSQVLLVDKTTQIYMQLSG